MKPIYARLLTIVLSLLITIIFLPLLLTRINPAGIITVFENIVPAYLIAGFIFYLGMQFLRTWRFYLLLRRDVSLKNLFPVACIYAMFVNLLPARTGELSYVYFLKTEYNKTTGEGLATLIISRILDCISLAISFVLFFFLIKETPLLFNRIILIGIVLIILLLLFLGALLFFGNKCLIGLKMAATPLSYKKIRPGDFIIKKGEETIASIEKFKTGERGLLLSVVLITVGISVTTYCFYLLLAMGINIHLHPLQILFASAFVLFTFMIPVQGIGGFGTTEGGWAVGLLAVGLSSEMAISSGFVFHIVNLLFAVVVGIFGYFSLRLSKILHGTGADA